MVRGKIYLFLSLATTGLEVAAVGLLGTFGLSVLETCFIKSETPGNFVPFFVLCVNLPVIIGCNWVLLRSETSKKNKALKRMIFVILSQSVLFGMPLISTITQSISDQEWPVLYHVSLLFGSSSGFILAVFRFGSLEMVKRIFLALFGKKSKGPGEVSLKSLHNCLIEETSMSNFFSDLTDETVRDIILNLSMFLLSNSSSKETHSFSYSKKKFYYQANDYFKLLQYINISAIIIHKNGIWAYEDETFQLIRENCFVNKSQMLLSLCTEQNLEILSNRNDGGRSNSFIFVTHDQKFIVKTISKQERYFLLDLLPSYSKRVIFHSESRIVRILGLYKLVSSKLSFIVMENVVKSRQLATVFDLKGSLDDRFVDVTGRTSTVYKDLNFIQMNKEVILDMETRNSLLVAISEDVGFFKKFNIIDYSLLLAVYEAPPEGSSRYLVYGLEFPEKSAGNEIDVGRGGSSFEFGNSFYSVGIIDFLQEYTMKKRFELCCKRCKGKVNTSVSSPGVYSSRFMNFIRRVFRYDFIC
jgi:hypothetical protein